MRPWRLAFGRLILSLLDGKLRCASAMLVRDQAWTFHLCIARLDGFRVACRFGPFCPSRLTRRTFFAERVEMPYSSRSMDGQNVNPSPFARGRRWPRVEFLSKALTVVVEFFDVRVAYRGGTFESLN